MPTQNDPRADIYTQKYSGLSLGFQFFEYLSFEFQYFANTQNTNIFLFKSLANFEKDNLK